jgi:PAS domain S-box-containing protein
MAQPQHNNQLLKHIFESSTQAILVFNAKKAITTINSAAQILFGYSKKELLQKNITHLIPTFKKTKNLQTFQNTSEIWITKKDGSQSSVHLKVSMIHTEGIENTILYIEDRTDHLIYQLALKGNQKVLSLAESEGSLGNWSWIFETDERYWSDEFYKICGLLPEDESLTAETVLNFIHPDDRERAIQVATNTIEQNIPYNIEKRIVQPNGTIRNVVARGKLDFDAQGIPYRMSGTMRDVTALKNRQLALEESNRKFNTLLEHTPGFIYRVKNDRKWTAIFMSEGCFSVTGYTHDEFIKSQVFYVHIILKEDQLHVWEQVQESLKSKRPYNIQYRIKTKNGDIKHLWERGEAIYSDKGDFIALEGYIQDITAQKETETQLRNSEAKSKALLKAIPDIMFIQDKAGVFLEFNVPAETKLLAPRDQILGKNMKDILPLDLYMILNKAQHIVLQKNKLQNVHYTLKKKGETNYYEARVVPIDSKNVLTIIRDISERKKMENVLKRSKEQLAKYSIVLEETVHKRTNELTATIQKLVESNLRLEDQIQETITAEKIAKRSSSLSSAIAKNFPNGFIIVFNPAFEMILKEGEAITQLRLNKLIFEGMRVNNIAFFSEEEKQMLKKQILMTLNGKHLRFEMEYNKRFFTVNTKPMLNENDKITTALFVYNDITFQKKIERDAQKALIEEQKLNELKSRFISMASHEFRTPLSAIQTSAILIGKQNEPGKEEKREKYVAQIKRNVKNLVVILNDFLSLSKLEEGKVVPTNEQLDIINFLKILIEETVVTKKNGQHIKFSAPKSAVIISLDHKLIRHIFMNLLSNAIKYSEDETTVYVTVKEDTKNVIIAITDEGIGIPEEDKEHLFERFFRAKNVSNIEGTGLGLNIAKQYVILMGGIIEFKSEVTKGSTFLVTFPKLIKA